MTTYQVSEVPDNGTVGQSLGEFDFADLPDRIKSVVARNVSADKWVLPALSGGDGGEEVPGLAVVVTRVVRHDTYLRFRCEAFSGEGVRDNRVAVQPDGVVLVWDSVANHYTACHSLSENAQRRIRSKAKRLVVA